MGPNHIAPVWTGPGVVWLSSGGKWKPIKIELLYLLAASVPEADGDIYEGALSWTFRNGKKAAKMETNPGHLLTYGFSIVRHDHCVRSYFITRENNGEENCKIKYYGKIEHTLFNLLPLGVTPQKGQSPLFCLVL